MLRRLAASLIAFFAIVLTFADCSSASSPPATTAAACNQPLPGAPGIAGGSAIEYTSGKPLTDELNGLQALGARWLRLDITWSDVQASGPTSYNWSWEDPPIKGALARGINIDANIAYTPSWARQPGTDDDKYPPTDPSTYASFAAATVRRYAPMGVHTWEIWNEENNSGFWKPAPNIAQYAALLQKAYAAIKGADPSATVLLGGLSSLQPGGVDPVTFLSGLYASGAGGSFDVVADHPYTFPDMPADSSNWAQMASSNPSLLSVMTAHGDGAKKIWVNEYGAPTRPGRVPEPDQANMITQAFQLLRSYPWAGPLFVYSYQDLGTDASTDDDFYGILRYDGSKKPSWLAFQQAASAFTTACSTPPTTTVPATSAPVTTAPATSAPATSAPPTSAPPTSAATRSTALSASRPPRSRQVGTTLLAVVAVALSAIALGRSLRGRRRIHGWHRGSP